MPLQNRVNPEGDICFSDARGSLMGNRGCLHDASKKIVFRTKRDAWVTCQLKFKDRKRPLMEPGLYTELFFLDEATALAAGHRPCGECRRARYKEFFAAWEKACGGVSVKAKDVDSRLKHERSATSRLRIDKVGSLPDGVIVKHATTSEYFLLRAGKAYPWGFNGYGSPIESRQLSGPFIVLTPESTVAAFRMGYKPEIHPTAL